MCKCACMRASAMCSTFYRASAVCPVTCGSWSTAAQPHKSRRLNQDKSWQRGQLLWPYSRRPLTLPALLGAPLFLLASKALLFPDSIHSLIYLPPRVLKYNAAKRTVILWHVIFLSALDQKVISSFLHYSFFQE